MIRPTVGRVVLFTPATNDERDWRGSPPFAAIIARVHSDSCVNLSVFDGDGRVRPVQSALSAEQGTPGDATWDWMPYQKAQASDSIRDLLRKMEVTDTAGTPIPVVEKVAE